MELERSTPSLHQIEDGSTKTTAGTPPGCLSPRNQVPVMSLTLEHRLMAGQTSGLPDAHILPYWAFSPAQCANTLVLESDL